MSPRNQPRTLLKLSFSVLSSATSDICWEFLCSYDAMEGCPYELEEFVEYLLDNLPNHFFDYLCHKILEDFSLHSLHTFAFSKPCYSKVLKTLLTHFLHKNMCYFNPAPCIQLPEDNQFWIDKLCCLEKLVVLNLNNLCNDEILEVVGAHCLLLEEIDLTSNDSSISDKGLLHLRNCKQLRKIIVDIDSDIDSDIGSDIDLDLNITHNGIKELIKSLPSLVVISHNEMGAVINEMQSENSSLSLPLVHITNYDCREIHIESMSDVCPNLKSLHLVTDYTSSQFQECDEIALALCESQLKLESMLLEAWTYTENLNRYIELKGMYLHYFAIDAYNTVSLNELILIGQHCPNLEKLHLENLKVNESNMNIIHLTENSELFKSLVELNLLGDWLPEVVLPLCVRNATKLKTLRLSTSSHNSMVDQILDLIQYNSLSELFVCHLSCYVTRNQFYELITHCKNLVELGVHRYDDDDDWNEFNSYIKNNNLNMILKDFAYRSPEVSYSYTELRPHTLQYHI